MPTASVLHDVRGVIENAIDIAASPQVVFDYCTDIRHETEWNPKVLEVEKLTEGPIGRGTRFIMRLAGVGWATTENVKFHRPTYWSATGASKRLDVRFEGEVAGTDQGSRLIVRIVLLPHGALRVALPILRRIMQQRWDGNLRTIKANLEAPSRCTASQPSAARRPNTR